MSPYPSLEKVLIIGSGPVKIGQTGAFDDAACRACEVFRSAGLQTVMIHCDPSALAADMETADRTYMVPLTLQSLTEIILREKPDALLPTVGGPTAMRLAKACDRSGLLIDNGIRLLGATGTSLTLIDNPSALFEVVNDLGLPAPDGQTTDGVSDAAAIAEAIGYPVFVRATDPTGALRQGVAYNVEELRQLAADGRLPSEKVGGLRIERALSAYREVEVELLRDADNRMQVVGMAENMDPVGIHSGDSAAVIPPVTIGEETCRLMGAAAGKLAGQIGVIGSLNVKFAVGATADQVLVLAVNPRFSRMSAFCAKAFDIDLATIHARLSLGTGLADALAAEGLPTARVGAASTVAIRLPRWEFERFSGEAPRLDACMKSTGEVMGLGRSLLEALQKAVRCRSPRHPLVGLRPELSPLSVDELMRRLVLPSPERLSMMHQALKKGADPEAVATVTGVHIHWVHQLADLAVLEAKLVDTAGNPPAAELIDQAVAAGFSASGLARLLNIPPDAADRLLSDAGINIRPRASADRRPTRIWFNTRADDHTRHAPLGKSVLIVGPGSGRIGHGIELDHCCVHAAKALRATGRQAVMVNANPAAAGGLNDLDRTYVEPLTADDLKAVYHSETPEGVILQFGGYAAMDLAGELSGAGLPVWGTDHEQVALSQDRLRFSSLLKDMGIPHPHIGMALSPEQAMDLAEAIGYPLVISVPAARQRNRYGIVMDAHMLEQDLMNTAVSAESPVLLEQFLEYAIEVEADALCDGRTIYVPAIMEHIELAGVHSGDSAMVMPPYSTPPRHVETISAYIHKVARELDVKGLLNARFAVYNDSVYLLAARPWACRSLPMVSKICNIPMAQRAVEIMLGMSLDEMDLPRRLLPHYGIRSSVFPFDTFKAADPLVGPQMRSTGQVMALAEIFGMAYYASQEAAGPTLPRQGKVLITVTDADKPSILEPARLFKEMGFGIQATRGTHSFLKKNGIQAELVKKLGFGRPDLVDAIKTGDVALVVNTPSGRQSQQDDAHIRKTAIRYHIPEVTTPAAALAAAKGIAARKRGQEALCTLQSYVRALK
ncbi:MAG: carbamoyl-phosphate synthase large subunit [Desulfobacteraceae bacterium]|jgi:carbamoyl-phosphate synthase large subunit|nr:carbamoyl-phosphate synthase large subunit [Desulfobacteraceae bacterium]